MFGELKLPRFPVEIITSDFLFKGMFEPKGDMLIYLNDDRYTVIRLDEVTLYPIKREAQIRGVKQPMMAINKQSIVAVTVLDEAKVTHISMLSSKRPFAAYTKNHAFRGSLHINADARDDDVFDETKSFFGVSDAEIYPLYAGRHQPTAKVPVMMLNQNQVLSYHPVGSGA